MDHFHFFAPAAKGTEGVLRDELRALGIRRVRATRGGVGFEGRFEVGMRACYWSRLAQRVLMEVGRGDASDADALYETAAAVEWEQHFAGKATFAVRGTGGNERLKHTGFIGLRTKDAIVDRMREKAGHRPDVDTKRPTLAVSVHVANDEATLYLDMSGVPLFKRGWRTEAGEAPLKETLAAAILALGGYDPDQPLCDPMCGSGTVVIEAALLARRIAPGRGRHFAFDRWPRFGDEERKAFEAIRADAKEVRLDDAPAPIIGRDRFAKPLESAEANAQRAGVKIQFERRDVRDLGGLPAACQLFTNPPYGERLAGKHKQLDGLYRGFGEAYAPLAKDHRLVVLSGSKGFKAAFDRKPHHEHTLFNGPLSCRLLSYGPKRR